MTVARTRNENATESKALGAQEQEHRLTFTAPGSRTVNLTEDERIIFITCGLRIDQIKNFFSKRERRDKKNN